MAVLTIPNLSINSWEPGATVGVGIPGGLERFRPGGANARTTLHNVVTSHGADHTGATDSSSAFIAASAATGAQEVIYIPYGCYKQSSAMYNLTKSNYTVRGAGSGVKSTTSQTIGTGIKTFTVPAGLGWTTGIGCRVWKNGDMRKWMQGLVVSYIGTALSVDFDDTSGDTDTLALWTVSQTFIDWTGAYYAPLLVGSADYFSAGEGTLSGDHAAGDSSITLAPGFTVAAGQLVVISMPDGPEVYGVGGFNGQRAYTNKIKTIVGNVAELEMPLYFDLPASMGATISSVGGHAQYVGQEDFAVSASDPEYQGPLISMNNAFACWSYNVRAHFVKNYHLTVQSSLRCEIRKTEGMWRQPGGSNGAGLLMGRSTACLVEDSIFESNPAWEINFGSIGNAFLYNYAPYRNYNNNHGPENSYNLYEGNVGPYHQWDGYFGGVIYDTAFRNYSFGGPGAAGWMIYNRMARYMNTVGNCLGTDGGSGGSISEGNPFMGNGYYTDPVNSLVGTNWRHLDGNGNSRVIGTITTRISDSLAIITLTSGHTIADFQTPLVFDNVYPNIVWGTNRRHLRTLTLDIAASSGAEIHMTTSTGYTGSEMPAEGTTVSFYMSAVGYPEQDLGVEYTAFKRANYISAGPGGAGAIDVALTGGDTLPNSLAYAGTPPIFSRSGMTYPPINPFAPANDQNVIPAAVRFNTGDDPEANGYSPVAVPDAPTTLVATAVSGTQVNLTWADGSSTELGFRIYKGSASGALSLHAVVAAGVTSYSVTGLSPGTEYFFQVRAYNEGGNSDPTNEDSDTTTGEAVPAAPTSLTATAVSPTQINLAWSDEASTETGFRILKGTVSGALTLHAAVPTPGLTSYSVTGLTAGTPYFFVVQAYNAGGNSTSSNEATATTEAGASLGSWTISGALTTNVLTLGD